MSNPFEDLLGKQENTPDDKDTWSGVFSCATIGCDGHSNLAEYDGQKRTLTWTCQSNHITLITGVDE